MKTLIFGADGQLGRAMALRLKADDMFYRGVDLPEVDVTNPEVVYDLMTDEKPDWVINASAYTQVDRAETERDRAFGVNRDGAGIIAKACQRFNASMIHISTDYVFDGEKKNPYRADDKTAPLGIYGLSKFAGEEVIRQSLHEHIIIRTSWLYGVHGLNFVKTMVRLGEEREVIRVVNDQFGCPTYADDLAEALASVVQTSTLNVNALWGTYHYCGMGVTSWHGFAVEIFRCIQKIKTMKVKEIQPIKTFEYPTPARRPKYSILDCSKIEEKMMIKAKPWQKSLESMINAVWNV